MFSYYLLGLIMPIKIKKKLPHQQFHDSIKKLMKNAGFEIEKSSYTASGPDIIAKAEGDRILIQCKSTEKKNEIFSGLEDLVNSYSKRADNEGALVSILAFQNYNIPLKYLKEENIKKLLQNKIVIWCDKDIDYYREIVKALGSWTRFSLLGDLGRKKSFGKAIKIPAFKVDQDSCEFCIFRISPEYLLKIADVFRRKKDAIAYQRMVSSRRVKKEIKEYLDNKDNQYKPLFPTNLVCVFPERTAIFDKKNSKLKIPIKPSSVLLIDGQHRLYGFCYIEDKEKRKNYDLICAGFNIAGLRRSSLENKDQAEIFVNINERAKKVPKDLLIDDAIRIGTADRRMKVVDKLKKTNIFKNKIQSVDTKGKIHITTFVYTTPMLRLLGDEKQRIGELSKWYGRKRERKKIPAEDEEKFIDFSTNLFEKYFLIIKGILGKKWEKNEVYFASTDRGIRAFLRIFSWILDYTNGLNDEEKAKKSIKILNNISFKKSEIKRKYSGEAGAEELANEWIGLIQEKFPDFGPRSELKEQYEVKNEIEARKKIKQIFSQITGDEVIGSLTFIDPTTIDYLKFIPPHCSIKIFTHGGKDWEKFKEEKEKKLRHKVVHIREIRCEDDKAYLHTRWISDKNILIEFANDLKEGALHRRQNIKIRDNPLVDFDYRDLREKWNKDELELKKLGLKMQRIA